MENVQLFILCTQFVYVSSVFNKEAALLKEGCLFILTIQAPCCGPRGLPRRRRDGKGWGSLGMATLRNILMPQYLLCPEKKSK